MASYLSIYRGAEGGAAKLALSQVSASNHPSVDRALRLLSAAWTEVPLHAPNPCSLRGRQLPGTVSVVTAGAMSPENVAAFATAGDMLHAACDNRPGNSPGDLHHLSPRHPGLTRHC